PRARSAAKVGGAQRCPGSGDADSRLTITTIVVFFPVVFLTGVAKNLFLPLALTIAFSLTMSFFVSRTVTPLLCLRFLQAEPQDHQGQRGVRAAILGALERLDHGYAGALRWVLGHRALVITVILIAFALSLLLGRRLGTEFFPDTDESQFQISYKT